MEQVGEVKEEHSVLEDICVESVKVSSTACLCV